MLPYLTVYWVLSLTFIAVNSIVLGYIVYINKCKFNAIFKSAFTIYSIVFLMRGVSTSLMYFD